MANSALLGLYAVPSGGVANAEKMTMKSSSVIGKVVSSAILYSGINTLNNQSVGAQ